MYTEAPKTLSDIFEKLENSQSKMVVAHNWAINTSMRTSSNVSGNSCHPPRHHILKKRSMSFFLAVRRDWVKGKVRTQMRARCWALYTYDRTGPYQRALSFFSDRDKNVMFLISSLLWTPLPMLCAAWFSSMISVMRVVLEHALF